MTMQTTYILLKVEHKHPIPHLEDHAAGRVETMSRVELVTASVVTPEEVLRMTTSVTVKETTGLAQALSGILHRALKGQSNGA